MIPFQACSVVVQQPVRMTISKSKHDEGIYQNISAGIVGQIKTKTQTIDIIILSAYVHTGTNGIFYTILFSIYSVYIYRWLLVAQVSGTTVRKRPYSSYR
jgi:galactitol-specific phosphotransferase system IIB component